MSPWLVGFSVFFGYPLAMSAYLSFNHYDLLSSPRWVGLANYEYLLRTDRQVWPAVKNTLWLMAFAVPLHVLFAFGVALVAVMILRPQGLVPSRRRAKEFEDRRHEAEEAAADA